MEIDLGERRIVAIKRGNAHMKITVQLNNKVFPGGRSIYTGPYALNIVADNTPQLHDYSVWLVRKENEDRISISFWNKDKSSRLIGGGIILSCSAAKRLALALLQVTDREGKIHYDVEKEEKFTEDFG